MTAATERPPFGHGATPWGRRRTLTTGLAVAAAAVLLVTLVSAAGSHRLGLDFRAAYLPAAEAIRDGRSPYEQTKLVADTKWHPYLYPRQLAIALAPATSLPVDVAAFLAFLASLAAVLAALAILGVRNIRCYAVALVWAPTGTRSRWRTSPPCSRSVWRSRGATGTGSAR